MNSPTFSFLNRRSLLCLCCISALHSSSHSHHIFFSVFPLFLHTFHSLSSFLTFPSPFSDSLSLLISMMRTLFPLIFEFNPMITMMMMVELNQLPVYRFVLYPVMGKKVFKLDYVTMCRYQFQEQKWEVLPIMFWQKERAEGSSS